MAPKEISGFESEPVLAAAPPDDTPADTPIVPDTATVEEVPEFTEGPEFLRKPDGEFVTEQSLASAQTNVVGDMTSAYNPVGIPDMYTIQGGMSGLGITGMEG